MAPIHDRMPVILSPQAWESWLDPGTDPAELQALLQPFAGGLIARQVSTLVNSPAHDGPALIAPAATEV